MERTLPWEKLLCGSASEFTVLQTDLTEPEALVQRLARRARESAPSAFAGKKEYVYLRLRYTPPCEQFRQLRKLVLREKEAAGLRADFRGIVALDATEWLGHEREEYFTVLLKYLYDHRQHKRTLLVLTTDNEARLRRFLTACAAYLTPRTLKLQLYSGEDTLVQLLEEEFLRLDKQPQREACCCLAQALRDPALAHVRSLQLPGRLAAQIAATVPTKTVSARQARQALQEQDCILTMMSGRSFAAGKEEHEKQLFL